MGKNVLEVEQKLLKVVPAKFKVDVHHWLILHGRYTCTARRPNVAFVSLNNCVSLRIKPNNALLLFLTSTVIANLGAKLTNMNLVHISENPISDFAIPNTDFGKLLKVIG
ncbi:hypothetical protein theurythT_30880 [Thalassotalea eurytherma]|uniref:RadC-like JAB domain-containing protein n=1 Tax=Thalassotalea eurytherma TaxID=1144278 RepID=A0ABQ6HA43_9GAMM|nr:hypothetical protein theurythT_30880 [Thalassotalea eurytherma]